MWPLVAIAAALALYELTRAAPAALAGGRAAVAAAVTQLGRPCAFGKASPAEGFDCAGLTSWAWRRGGVELPMGVANQLRVTAPITSAEAQPGDLIFYRYTDRNGSGPDHVAMYAGAGKMIEAAGKGADAKVQTNPVRPENLYSVGRVTGSSHAR